MSADRLVDLVINQRASFEVTFNVIQANNAPLNLGGYTANAALKTDFYANDTSATHFTTTIANAQSGSITIALSPDQTANLDITKYYYDVVITDTDGFKTRVVEGRARVSGGVAR